MEDLFKKTDEDSNKKLEESIAKFSTAFKALSPAAKVAFQNQITAQMRKMDDRTKKLYETLIKSAQDGFDTKKTIGEMEKTDRQTKGGI